MTALKHTNRSQQSRNSKARAKSDERDVAARLGGKRHLADTGGPEDVAHEWLAVQVKGGKAVVTQALREGMDSAQVAAVGKTKLPCVVLVDRKGTRIRRYIVFELDQFAEWNGLNSSAEMD